MEIKTKFNIGDTVFYADHHKVQCGKIVAVEVLFRESSDPKIMGNKLTINYTINPLDLTSSRTVRSEDGLYTEKNPVLALIVDDAVTTIRGKRYSDDVLNLVKEAINNL